MKQVFTRLILLVPALFLSCSDEDDVIETRTNLLVNQYWYNSEIIGITPSGYSVVSPIVFRQDNKVYIGGNQAEWAFIENATVLKMTYPKANYSDRYKIINLTKSEFHFMHYSTSGDFLAELKYKPR